MKKFTKDKIKNVMDSKGYAFFEEGRYNLNIIGIRSNNSKSDFFDDEIHVLYKDQHGKEKHEIFPCTTDPGKHWLLNPLNIRGTIILVPKQYRGVYKIGLHNRSRPSRSYTALEQIKPMDYVRDNSKDAKLDFDLYLDSNNIESSIAKTNIHRASQWRELLNIGRYSAGCQVIQSPYDFEKFIDLCESQVEWGFGRTFTYTLLEEKDFKNE
jgi:hypothetical protein